MTRSEEQLRTGTERVEAGRTRLRKYVVTDTEQVEVPVAGRRSGWSGSRSPRRPGRRRTPEPAIARTEHG